MNDDKLFVLKDFFQQDFQAKPNPMLCCANGHIMAVPEAEEELSDALKLLLKQVLKHT